MKIISLQSENFKRLTAVHIEPSGNLVQITGKNAQGKSSVLDSIWVALAGLSVAPREPIRKGAEVARIRLDLGEILVTRTFKRADKGQFTTSLTVENAEGARYPSPQKLLDGLLSALSFDPLAFSRLDAKGQFDALRRFVPDVDFDKIQKDHDADYAKRADVNKRLNEAKASAENIKAPESPPVQPVDESALVTKLREAGEHNADIEKRKSNRELAGVAIRNSRAQAKAKRDEAETLKAQIADLERQASAFDNDADILEKRLLSAEPLPEPVNVSAVANELNDARDTNRKYVEWSHDIKRRGELRALALQLAKESDDLTTAINARKKGKQDAIAKAVLPIDGLAFGEGYITLNDVPFDQASDAEKLRTSVAIAMAANSKLKVIRIRDGSLLDDDGLRLIAEMADERDVQVWIERVDSTGKVGIVLEDGHLRVTEESQTETAKEA